MNKVMLGGGGLYPLYIIKIIKTTIDTNVKIKSRCKP